MRTVNTAACDEAFLERLEMLAITFVYISRELICDQHFEVQPSESIHSFNCSMRLSSQEKMVTECFVALNGNGIVVHVFEQINVLSEKLYKLQGM